MPIFRKLDAALKTVFCRTSTTGKGIGLGGLQERFTTLPGQTGILDLSPRYLATIPNDLFSAKPLIYKPSDKGYFCSTVSLAPMVRMMVAVGLKMLHLETTCE